MKLFVALTGPPWRAAELDLPRSVSAAGPHGVPPSSTEAITSR